MKEIKSKWRHVLSENGRKNHTIFSIFLVTILPSWSIFDYFAVKNLFSEIFYFRFISAFCIGILGLLCHKRKISYIILGYAITLVAYIGVGAFLPFLTEDKIQYWCVGYSTCFVTWSLFQTWRRIHHIVNILTSFFTVSLLILLFSPLHFSVYIINGLLLTASVAIVCSGLFYIRHSFMYKTFILTEELNLANEDLKSKNQNISVLLVENEKRHKEKIELQEELAKKEKIAIEKDKLATIGSMSAGISHDFNNSLNILQQGIRALKVAVEKNDKTMIENILANMVHIIRISSNLIQSIKGLQKIEDKVKIIDLKLFTNTICSLYKGLSFEDVFIKNEIQNNLLIETDELNLYNALANIIKNAIESSLESAKKTIEINAKLIENAVIIDISDYGEGVSEDQNLTIFDGISTKKDGLGFGLKSTMQNLKKVGGNLELISLKDPTTFRITLRTKNDLSSR